MQNKSNNSSVGCWVYALGFGFTDGEPETPQTARRAGYPSAPRRARPRLENRNRQHVGFREQSMKASDGSGTRLETPLQRGAKRENVLLVQHAISLRNGTGGDRGLDTVQRLDIGEPHTLKDQ